MAASKAQIRASAKYAQKTYRQVLLKIRNDNIKVIKKLESVKSKNSYIIGLIEKDIEK